MRPTEGLGAVAQPRRPILGRALMAFLNRLGQDVKITVNPARKRSI
jgi:hypothetical protein